MAYSSFTQLLAVNMDDDKELTEVEKRLLTLALVEFFNSTDNEQLRESASVILYKLDLRERLTFYEVEEDKLYFCMGLSSPE
jgi:hypothetical protein